MTFDAYWDDARFQIKKPNLGVSNKTAFGDNIYHRVQGGWAQANSHHSFADGSPNPRNIRNDTRTNQVLVGQIFAYWGGSGPTIPESLRNHHGHDLCIGRGYKRHFPDSMEVEFTQWFESFPVQGYLGRPLDWGAR
jgi:hypothetical protein